MQAFYGGEKIVDDRFIRTGKQAVWGLTFVAIYGVGVAGFLVWIACGVIKGLAARGVRLPGF